MAFSRRHLPHWIPDEAIIFVTWRLAGSVPRLQERQTTKDDGLSHCIPSGPDWLQDSRIASVVVNALLYGEAVRKLYRLHAWVIMPNHVHVIWQPLVAMPTINRWVKGRTSSVANRILRRTRMSFWQDESFDHWVRSAEELQGLIAYVVNNPVKAGLADAPEEWRWSSAGWITCDTLAFPWKLAPFSTPISPFPAPRSAP